MGNETGGTRTLDNLIKSQVFFPLFSREIEAKCAKVFRQLIVDNLEVVKNFDNLA